MSVSPTNQINRAYSYLSLICTDEAGAGFTILRSANDVYGIRFPRVQRGSESNFDNGTSHSFISKFSSELLVFSPSSSLPFFQFPSALNFRSFPMSAAVEEPQFQNGVASTDAPKPEPAADPKVEETKETLIQPPPSTEQTEKQHPSTEQTEKQPPSTEQTLNPALRKDEGNRTFTMRELLTELKSEGEDSVTDARSVFLIWFSWKLDYYAHIPWNIVQFVIFHAIQIT